LRLNPEKCVFKVERGNFLGFMLTHRGILKKMMELNKPRGGELVFKTKYTFKNRVTKKLFAWIVPENKYESNAINT